MNITTQRMAMNANTEPAAPEKSRVLAARCQQLQQQADDAATSVQEALDGLMAVRADELQLLERLELAKIALKASRENEEANRRKAVRAHQQRRTGVKRVRS